MNGEVDQGASLTCRIEVTEILTRIGRVTDITTLTAAILHHVFDSSDSVKQELDVHFGPEVRMLVQELAGDKRQTDMERLQNLLDRAPFFSMRAKQIVIAEKIVRLQELKKGWPEGWPIEQLRGYMTFIGQIAEACRGVNADLEDEFDELYAALSLGMERTEE